MDKNISIRKATSNDVPAILELMREFAEFEYLLEYLEVTEENLHEVLFGENAFVSSLVALDDEKAVAYAIFYPHFSSFRGQKSVYLEDIYISENYRKYGLGEKMLKEIASFGRGFGAVRMDFQVLKWNAPAIKFYEKHGGRIDEEERHFRITDDAFFKLAGE
jgi:ribosomal protein S18 acetylase RimI-like enzyme